MIYEFFVKIDMIKVAPKETGIHDLLRKRWSARSFSEAMIGDDELMNVFQAASWASSSMNEQPWRFVYAKKGSDSYEHILSTLVPMNAIWAGKAPHSFGCFCEEDLW